MQIPKRDSADFRSAVLGVALVVVAALVAVGLGLTHRALPPLWALVGLAVVAAAAERQSIKLTDRIETSVSFLPIVFAAVAFGPLTAFIVGASAAVADLHGPRLRSLVYTPAHALTGAAAGTVAWWSAGSSSKFGAILMATIAASVVDLAADAGFNCLTLAVRRTGTVLMYARTMVPLFALSLPLYVPLVALFVYGYRIYSLWIIAMFFVPAIALQGLIGLYQEQREATRELSAANARLERANLSFATALVATLDARDRYTAGHSAAVAVYARDIAARMGLSEREQQRAYLAGLVHDIGKIGLPPGLLEKPGALTLDERRQMEAHSVIGERILAKVDDYAEIAAIVRHHHERVDGRGYPDQVAGDEIPLVSRIIAVADAYNAMTSDRPYRDAMPSRVARLRLAQAVESQFDTSVVAAFEAILAGAAEDYRLGLQPKFAPDAQTPALTSSGSIAA